MSDDGEYGTEDGWPPLGQTIPTDPHDEDGYCAWCGNGWWKPHAYWCAWMDAVDDDTALRSTPKRIQLRRSKGWRKPEGAIVVARPTRWGNPVVWSAYRVRDAYTGGTVVASKDAPAAARRIAVDGFRSMLADPECRAINKYPNDEEIRSELAGHDLACWCPLDQPCHADVLLELANS